MTATHTPTARTSIAYIDGRRAGIVAEGVNRLTYQGTMAIVDVSAAQVNAMSVELAAADLVCLDMNRVRGGERVAAFRAHNGDRVGYVAYRGGRFELTGPDGYGPTRTFYYSDDLFTVLASS